MSERKNEPRLPMLNARPQPTLREAIQERYTAVAERGLAAAASGPGGCCGPDGSCCGGTGLYTSEEIDAVTDGAAAASAGCGNPTAIGELKPGETVVDLGSGGGIDCFLAARQVGPEGYVIGIDMTPAMVRLAQQNAEKLGTDNVVFKLAPIESIPEPDGTADAVISNCVINLASDKRRVFAEAFRVLKPGGRIYISDIVVTDELPEEVREDVAKLTGCIAGADLYDVYMGHITGVGFDQVEVVSDVRSAVESEPEWADAVRSISVRAVKP